MLSLLIACAAAPQALPVTLTQYLTLPPVGAYGRSPIRMDALAAKAIREGGWRAPTAGERLTMPDGRSVAWQAAQAGEDGWLRHPSLRGGYAYASFDAPKDGVYLLEALGASACRINGSPRAGDPYSNGALALPFKAKHGRNDLFFQVSRGELRVRIAEAPAPVFILDRDMTLPDILREEAGPFPAGVTIVNATEEPVRLSLSAKSGDRITAVEPEFSLAPLTIRKEVILIPKPPDLTGDTATVELKVNARGAQRIYSHSRPVAIAVRTVKALHRRTFISAVDGSVQYYAVQPATGGGANALVLSCHGASVEAWNQAASYAPKSWATIVAPTNRRPFGFDWEDWGRLDAMEALEDATRRYQPDPTRIYLTGHSMGGHGAWQLACQFPGSFAATAPSAGWLSFATYGGGARFNTDDPVQAILSRAANPTDTFALFPNLDGLGIYILHGDADDNVPPQQARRALEELAKFHHDYTAHFQPGAGHWWDASPEPGADCVDWPPIFDLFSRRRLPAPEEVRAVSFRTFDPTIASQRAWVAIWQQERPLELSTVEASVDPHRKAFTIHTENVRTLELRNAYQLCGQVSLAVNDRNLSATFQGESLYLKIADGRVEILNKPPVGERSRSRSGFKWAYTNQFVLVYGTKGSEEEARWSFEKARFDAETFLYRGNGRAVVVSDVEWVSHPTKAEHNVVLYGSSESNAAWTLALSDSAPRVMPGKFVLDERAGVVFAGDVGCVFGCPRKGSDRALVGVVAGTGRAGREALTDLPFFVSGAHWPDWTVYSGDALEKGAEGILGAGFFAPDWSYSQADSAIRKSH
jgi:poly(3-hydroxybutyrate) depolymerase